MVVVDVPVASLVLRPAGESERSVWQPQQSNDGISMLQTASMDTAPH